MLVESGFLNTIMKQEDLIAFQYVRQFCSSPCNIHGIIQKLNAQEQLIETT